jgi:hypothetical protein
MATIFAILTCIGFLHAWLSFVVLQDATSATYIAILASACLQFYISETTKKE